jgi:hypothetical protein
MVDMHKPAILQPKEEHRVIREVQKVKKMTKPKIVTTRL